MIEQRDALYLEDPVTNASYRIFFTYDTMNRVKAKYYGTAHFQPTATPVVNIPDVKYYYDDDLSDASTKKSWGKLRHVEVTLQGQGQEKANGHGYEYDLKGRPVADVITTTNYYNTRSEYVVRYTYDVGNRMCSVTYPDPEATPETISISYNIQGMG